MNPKEMEVYFKIFGLYKNNRHLWDKKNINYGNKGMALDAFNKLLKIYKEFDPDATVEILKSRINNKKSAFKRELAKVKKSDESGSTPKYIPRLWYYDYLTFLSETCDDSSDSSDEEILYEADFSENESEEYEATIPVPMKKIRQTVKENQETGTTLDKKIPNGGTRARQILVELFALELQNLNEEQFTIVNKLMTDVIFHAKFGNLTVNSSINLGHQ